MSSRSCSPPSWTSFRTPRSGAATSSPGPRWPPWSGGWVLLCGRAPSRRGRASWASGASRIAGWSSRPVSGCCTWVPWYASASVSRNAPRNTDDRPHFEFRAGRFVAGRARAFLKQGWPELVAQLMDPRRAADPSFLGPPPQGPRWGELLARAQPRGRRPGPPGVSPHLPGDPPGGAGLPARAARSDGGGIMARIAPGRRQGDAGVHELVSEGARQSTTPSRAAAPGRGAPRAARRPPPPRGR